MPQPIAEVRVADLPVHPAEDFVLLDVREDDEWRAGHIDAAVHIPMGSVPARLAEIPVDRPIVVVCRSGGRSAQVTGFLAAAGREAVNLAGGMHAWSEAGRPMTSDGASAPSVI